MFGDSKASDFAAPDADEIVVSACRGEIDFGIYSTTFLEQAFRTDAYRITLTFHDDGSWGYRTATELKLEGHNTPFPHQDRNRQKRVGDPLPNPWVAIIARRKA